MEALRRFIATLFAHPLLTLFAAASAAFAIVLTIFGMLLFVVIARDVAGETGISVFDTSLSVAFYAHATPTATAVYRVVTWFGGPGLVLVIAIAALAFVAARRWASLAVWSVGIGGGALLNGILKGYFARPRPVFDVPLAIETSFSFPSAHAMTSFIAYGLLMVLVWREIDSRLVRIFAAFVTVMLVVFIGISRMALGVHYLSDVLAGYSAGAVWLGVCLLLRIALERRTALTLRSNE